MSRRHRTWTLAVVGLVSASILVVRSEFRKAGSTGSLGDVVAPIDFERDVAPIFRRHCVRCHGAEVQEKGLRLDTWAEAAAGSDFGPVIVPGKPRLSPLWEHVSGEQPAMPPDAEPLSAVELATLSRWIAEASPSLSADRVGRRGGRGGEHWAYQPVEHRDPPGTGDSAWCLNEIDRFVLALLESRGLEPAAEADRATLARRLALDVTGLPPTIAELDSFLADALEHYVDRLIASPHYGEQAAGDWLDLARYADSHGYHRDAFRSMWMYRERVIDAFNSGMPFDEFTIEQLAGDLLPDATDDQKIASGFHRNTLFNQEGGVDPEEFRVKAVIDRVDTTATVWLGTTLACARCHDHPTDPFTTRDYFRMYAYFNNTADDGGGKYARPDPQLEFPEPDERRQLVELRGKIAARRREIASTELPGFVDDGLLGELVSQEERLLAAIPTALVMSELAAPRLTRMHVRGDRLAEGEAVEPGVPAVLPPPPADSPPNRLGLARWLVSGDHPLTARVFVNRLWRRLFHFPLTQLDDFGLRTERPPAGDLLDYLADDFVRHGWDVKRLTRRLVTSATYRQAASGPVAGRVVDPAVAPLVGAVRRRLAAETLRDNALAVAGLIDRRVGGPSVFPPQPPGLWADVEIDYDNDFRWRESAGGDRYRRGLYVFRRRSYPYPSLAVFDAASRESCVVERQTTNTPLQALALLNDPVFVEAAEGLARRMLDETSNIAADVPPDPARLAYGFRLCTGRPPETDEAAILARLLESERARYSQSPLRDALFAGRSAPEGNAGEFAAWTVVANVLLNLDASIYRR